MAFCESSQEQFFYLWGSSGSGVSHLLQAVQHQLLDQQTGLKGAAPSIQYLPLAELLAYPAADVCAGLEQLDMVVIDNIEALAGNSEWELALFALYNRLRDNNKRLLVGAAMSPRQLPIQLADLQSRLQWGTVYQLSALSDQEKSQALAMRAQALGLDLGVEVIQFIMTHTDRNIHQLIAILARVDNASLAEKRRITIPFVKQVLALA